jgi:cytochrome c2
MSMRCTNLIVGTLFFAVLTACGDPEPVSTGTKAPGLNRASGNQQPATTGAPGDAAKGKTAFTACAVCHPSTAQVLDKADANSVAGAAGKSYHSSVAKVFETDAANIKAYLETL